jgi:hypothetical protein
MDLVDLGEPLHGHAFAHTSDSHKVYYGIFYFRVISM